MKRDIFGTPTILKRYTIGRRVWVRIQRTLWREMFVHTVSNDALVLRDARRMALRPEPPVERGKDVEVPYRLLYRDVRVREPQR